MYYCQDYITALAMLQLMVEQKTSAIGDRSWNESA
jgi:hypothetical protein